MLIIKLSMLVMFNILYYFISLVCSEQHGFIFNGFQSKGLSLDGAAGFTGNGLLKITNATTQQKGHAFYPQKITFKQNSSLISSFSTTFVFAIVSKYSELSGHGLAFVIAPTTNFSQAQSNHYLGLFKDTNNGNASNHVLAVELDIIQSTEFDDIDDNHVGIDINGLKSVTSKHAGYYQNTNGELRNLTLKSGHRLQIWIDYDGMEKQLNVTLAPVYVDKPKKPLLSLHYDLSPIVYDVMYVGFTSSTGSVPTSHYVLGWSFMVNGVARGLDLVQLPKLPHVGPKEISKFVIIGLPLIVIFLVTLVISGIMHHFRKKWKYAEVLEDWELDYGPHRFKYKDLYIATKGFKEKELLGSGGFGRVYRGVLNSSEIAVKRVSHESRQGMKEFVAEIVSIGRLRHRNIVPLLGYCRRKNELLLVYDYMPNGSLDKILFDQQPKFTFNWNHRFRVIKGVASGLNYLHQEWEQVVIHRDVKASNVLLDGELNGRLGDFGLARLYDHGTDPQTTHVVGTIGYLAPENTRTGKATTSTDVFAFGAFLLEVTCGRRPIEVDDQGSESFILVDWVFSCWSQNDIVQAIDPRMGDDYVVEEVELVLKLGLLCSNYVPECRPSMQEVVQYLDGYAILPELSTLGITAAGLTFSHQQGFSDVVMSFASSTQNVFSGESSMAESLLSSAR